MAMVSELLFSREPVITPHINNTGFTPSSFILAGIPGLEDVHIWMAAPLTAIYIITLLGNCTLLLVIKKVVNLHKPLYLVISQLAFVDLMLSSSVLPKLLSILWFNNGEISFSACLIQMFFSFTFLGIESSILLTMAFDRYVAICYPLRYSTILTHSVILNIVAATSTRVILIIAPLPLIFMAMPFCSRNVTHSYCENMAVAKLSCADITVNNVYGLAIMLLIVPVDIVFIAFSYILIVRAILCLPFRKDRCKTISTCGSHICVISIFYVPLFCSVLLHRFYHKIPLYVHVMFSDTCIIFPPFMNPLIYGLTMKEVRCGMQQLFQKIRSSLRL